MRLVMCRAKVKKIFHFLTNISKIFHKIFSTPLPGLASGHENPLQRAPDREKGPLGHEKRAFCVRMREKQESGKAVPSEVTP